MSDLTDAAAVPENELNARTGLAREPVWQKYGPGDQLNRSNLSEITESANPRSGLHQINRGGKQITSFQLSEQEIQRCDLEKPVEQSQPQQNMTQKYIGYVTESMKHRDFIVVNREAVAQAAAQKRVQKKRQTQYIARQYVQYNGGEVSQNKKRCFAADREPSVKGLNHQQIGNKEEKMKTNKGAQNLMNTLSNDDSSLINMLVTDENGLSDPICEPQHSNDAVSSQFDQSVAPYLDFQKQQESVSQNVIESWISSIPDEVDKQSGEKVQMQSLFRVSEQTEISRMDLKPDQLCLEDGSRSEAGLVNKDEHKALSSSQQEEIKANFEALMAKVYGIIDQIEEQNDIARINSSICKQKMKLEKHVINLSIGTQDCNQNSCSTRNQQLTADSCEWTRTEPICSSRDQVWAQVVNTEQIPDNLSEGRMGVQNMNSQRIDARYQDATEVQSARSRKRRNESSLYQSSNIQTEGFEGPQKVNSQQIFITKVKNIYEIDTFVSARPKARSPGSHRMRNSSCRQLTSSSCNAGFRIRSKSKGITVTSVDDKRQQAEKKAGDDKIMRQQKQERKQEELRRKIKAINLCPRSTINLNPKGSARKQGLKSAKPTINLNISSIYSARKVRKLF